MKCVACGKLSLPAICNSCISNIDIINSMRVLENGVRVYSSFPFSEIRHLILSKYDVAGSRVYRALGAHAVKNLFLHKQELLSMDKENFAVIGVDDFPRRLYSHTGIIARAFKRYGFKVIHGAIRHKEAVNFHLLGAKERQRSKINFKINVGKNVFGVIICDDVITTGGTILQASNALKECGIETLFAFTLCDAGN